jgi:hypothetical protein
MMDGKANYENRLMAAQEAGAAAEVEEFKKQIARLP